MITVLLCTVLSLETGADDRMAAALEEVQALVTAETNRAEPFTPTVTVDRAEAGRRHTPLLHIDSPWNGSDVFDLEVPEYSWARVPGDTNNGSPFYYGRQIGVSRQWVVRYPSLEPPRWQRGEGGSLALDNPLKGGYVQRFRVVPHDRLLEVRFGVTNGSQKALTNLRCQLCLMSHKVASLGERWPTSSKFYSQGKLLSWDSAGQDLAWLDPHRDSRSGRFDRSCFFLAPLLGHEPPGFPEKERARADLMWFGRSVDVPAIAKVDPEKTDRGIVVYSPHGRGAFYNVLVPCFHADPQMKSIAPGETRWTASYYMFVDGDLEGFFRRLAALHGKLAAEEGYLDLGTTADGS